MNINPLSLNKTFESELLLSKKNSEEQDFASVLENAVASKDDVQLKEACEQVETYMLTTIFKQMKQSTEMGERLIEKGDYEEMFEDQMIEEQCKNMVKSGGIGLADMMYRQMSMTSETVTDIKL